MRVYFYLTSGKKICYKYAIPDQQKELLKILDDIRDSRAMNGIFEVTMSRWWGTKRVLIDKTKIDYIEVLY